MIDWNNVFFRQWCPKIGIESFQRNGSKNSIIPLLTSYFQEYFQSVKWRGVICSCGGPQGDALGNLEYLSQSKKSADSVEQDNRFMFVDDRTILELVNFLTIGLSSFNIMAQVPNDIREDNQHIKPENRKSQDHFTNISSWTKNIKY